MPIPGRRRLPGPGRPARSRRPALLARAGALHPPGQAGPGAAGRPPDRAAARHRPGPAISTAARSCARPTATSSMCAYNDWWGEPLGSDAGARAGDRPVAAPARLAPSTARAARSRPTPTPSLAVNIQRLDVDQSGTLQLLAQAAVEFNRPERIGRAHVQHRQARAGRDHRGPGRRRQRRRRRAHRRARRAAAALIVSPATGLAAAEPPSRIRAARVLRLRHVPARAGARPRHARGLRALRHVPAPHPPRPVEPRARAERRHARAVRGAVDGDADEGLDRRHRARYDAGLRAARAGAARPVAAGAGRVLHHRDRTARQISPARSTC